VATRHPDRLASFSTWIATHIDCGQCFDGLIRRNKITGATWCPNCDYETESRVAGPGLDPVPVPELPLASAPAPQAEQPGASVSSDDQPSGCACEKFGFDLIVYPTKTSVAPEVEAKFRDPRKAAECARHLNLLRPIGQQFPLYSSRGGV